jgi:hypothetical protein
MDHPSLAIMMLAIAFASSACRRPATASVSSAEDPGQALHLLRFGRFLVEVW